MNEILLENYSSSDSESVIFKIVLTIICSCLLGWERARKKRPAGVRTFMLVSLGACLIGMLGVFISQNIGNADPSRLGAQVISGIGFIGAGTIILNGYHQIKGLTTAAGLWVAACIGLSIGIGFIVPACIVTFAISVIMIPLDKLEIRFLSRIAYLNVMVIINKNIDLAMFFRSLNNCNSLKITDIEIFPCQNTSSTVFYLMLKLYENTDRQTVLQRIQNTNGVDYAEII